MSETRIDLAEIERGFAKIIDPELGRPITELKLIDSLTADGGLVTVEFHLTAPFCPPMFALTIASDIKAAVLAANGVSDAKVTLRGHYLAEAVNKQVNKISPPKT
jgi:ATP-binding protein involved in chromosome partitioning